VDFRLPGFEVKGLVREGRSCAVYRGRRLADDLPVAIKRPLAKLGPAAMLLRCRHEYDILAGLDHPGIIKTYGVATQGDTPALILEGFDGAPLTAWCGSAPRSLLDRLDAATQAAAILGAVHAAGIVHGNVNSHNFLIHSATGAVLLVDFAAATTISAGVTEIRELGTPDGSLAYISPEQTGRINRRVDDRSDWYSLGMTLFELFTGRLPLPPSSDIDWIHFHLAGETPPLTALDPRIPEPISDVVRKLLAREPEERYQSAAGIIADLETCAEQLSADGEMRPFVLGSRDPHDRFELPQALFGRESETQALLDAFERVARGATEIARVFGSHGTGKTALVHQLQLPVAQRRGYFVTGRCGANRRAEPFGPIVDALRELIGQVLTENESAVRVWRDAILEALADNAQVIVDVLPELAHIIGRQAPVRAMADDAARIRFQDCFTAFVQVFARRSHPLVLFLDDMEHVDAATAGVVELLLSARKSESLLIVETWDPESAACDTRAVTARKRANERGTTIELSSLHENAIAAYIAAAFRQSVADSQELAATVSRKTAGKPLYMREFLLSLHERGQIDYDAEAHRFVCAPGAAEAAEITANVAQGLAARLKTLASPTPEALKIAAVIGRRFDLPVLARVRQATLIEVVELLKPARDAGYIVPVTETGLPSAGDATAGAPSGAYAFAHDYLHQAAFALSEARERPALHLAIGRAMIAGGEEQVERRLLDVVTHLNHGAGLVETRDERLQIATLNRRAADKMRNAAAYDAAQGFYRAALALLGQDPWRDDHSLCFSLHAGLADVLLLGGHVEAAIAMIEAALAHATSFRERAQLGAAHVKAYMRRNEPGRALQCGLSALQSLGVVLPEDPAELERSMQQELSAVLDQTDQTGTHRLTKLKRMEDRDKIAKMGLLRQCLPAAFQTNFRQFAVICGRMVAISLRDGNCIWSAGAYGSFAVLLASRLGRYRDADGFARAGMELAAQLNDSSIYPESCLLRAMFTSHWVAPIEQSIELFDRSVRRGLETGDHATVVNSTIRRLGHLLFRGHPLAALRRECEAALGPVGRVGDDSRIAMVRGFLHVVNALSGLARHDPASDAAEERELTAAIATRENFSMQAEWHLLLMRKRLVAGDYRAALEMAQAFEKLEAHTRAFVIESEFAFYRTLTLTGLWNEASPEERLAMGERIAADLARLSDWAKLCPANRGAMHLLVRAELARIDGDLPGALQGYDAAIAAARASRFLHVEALAAERASRFWLDRGKTDFSALYRQRAARAWERFGALGRVADLNGTSRLDATGQEPAAAIAVPVSANVSAAAGEARHLDRLDLALVVKASQVIAGEIVLADLLAKLLDIVIENAGGDRIALVLKHEGAFVIQGIREPGADGSLIMLGEHVEGTRRIARRIVNYVLRTREHLVLSDPARMRQFQADSYVQSRQPRSVLCAPIVHKGELEGAIYVENTKLAGAFTPGRVEAIDILLAQIAISIENARYHDHLEELVAQRTREVETANEKLKAEVAGREEALRKLEESHEQIRSLAYLDGLTGLPNRRLLKEHLNKVLARCQRKNLEFAVLFVDLDNFKLINDSIGHQAADSVLRSLAATLSDLIRAEDILAANIDEQMDFSGTISISPITESVLSRLGGDEFVVLLPEIRDRFAAASVAKRILDRLERPFDVEGQEVFVSVSVGIATFPEDGQTADVLLRNADTAMYHAKQLGKGMYQYYSEKMNLEAVERLTLESGLRKALDEDRLELHYQPQVDIATGRIVGAEALLRWNDPVRGYISPATFVPIAESGGLILPLGEWVLKRATRQAVAWRAEGLPSIPVSVNVSGTQFRRQDIVDLVRRALDESGLEPAALSIEITETSLMSMLDRAAEVLHRLREIGVSTALDDFGTGYSSLSYLKAFPLDALKIDRSFIAEILTDRKTAALTEAIVTMTRTLDLKVVAEGIENAAQLEYLRKLGCTTAQGFYFSRPVPPDEFARIHQTPPAHWRRPVMQRGRADQFGETSPRSIA
jgi:predicted signal transduction protein with EAL and GGDEF domain/predicted ATPase